MPCTAQSAHGHRPAFQEPMQCCSPSLQTPDLGHLRSRRFRLSDSARIPGRIAGPHRQDESSRSRPQPRVLLQAPHQSEGRCCRHAADWQRFRSLSESRSFAPHPCRASKLHKSMDRLNAQEPCPRYRKRWSALEVKRGRISRHALKRQRATTERLCLGRGDAVSCLRILIVQQHRRGDPLSSWAHQMVLQEQETPPRQQTSPSRVSWQCT